MADFADNFDRADGGLGSDWELFHYSNDLVIVDGQVTGSTADAYNGARFVGGTIGNHQYSQVELATAGRFYLSVRTTSLDETTSPKDDFDRDDGGLGSNWTDIPGWLTPVISGNEIASSGDSTAGAFRSDITLDDDQYAQLTIKTSGDWIGVLARVGMSVLDGYWLVTRSTYFRLYRFNNGTSTLLVEETLSSVLGTNDKIHISIRGQNPVIIHGIANADELIYYEDSSADRILSGYPGFSVNKTTVRADDWIGGSISGAEKFYHLLSDNSTNDFFIRRTVASRNVVLWDGSGTYEPGVGDAVRFEAKGDQINAYINDTLVGSATDDYISTGGPPGIGCYGTTVRVDNWQGGDVGTAYVKESGWRIGAGRSGELSWRLLGEEIMPVSWRILKDVDRGTSWRVLNINDEIVGWRILDRMTTDFFWRVCRVDVKDLGWRILDGEIPEVVATFALDQSAVFAFNLDDKAIITFNFKLQ